MKALLLSLACITACATAAPPPPPPPAKVVLSSSTPSDVLSQDSIDAIRAKRYVHDSASWGRVTLEAYEKSTRCLSIHAVGGAPKSTHRPGELFHTYVSPDAIDAYRDGGTLPIGGVVSKRAFDPTTNATTTYFLMWKEAAAKWSYATVSADGSVLRTGALADCAGCHDQQREHDFLFRKL